jgi:hypothetical protein
MAKANSKLNISNENNTGNTDEKVSNEQNLNPENEQENASETNPEEDSNETEENPAGESGTEEKPEKVNSENKTEKPVEKKLDPEIMGSLKSRLDYALPVTYNGEELRVSPRSEIPRIIKSKLGNLPTGIYFVKK